MQCWARRRLALCQVDDSHLKAELVGELNDDDSDNSGGGVDAEDLRIAERLKLSLGLNSHSRSSFGTPSSPRTLRYFRSVTR
jgi:hypothetical protein